MVRSVVLYLAMWFGMTNAGITYEDLLYDQYDDSYDSDGSDPWYDGDGNGSYDGGGNDGWYDGGGNDGWYDGDGNDGWYDGDGSGGYDYYNAVSYTHLDVYKRQGGTLPISKQGDLTSTCQE